MAIDIFSIGAMNALDERVGGLLAKKDLKEERHEMKKTDEDMFSDCEHNLRHPFMRVLLKDAERYARDGKPWILSRRLQVLIDDEDSDERWIYYNEGDTWRQSANALCWKVIKEMIPDLLTPGMKFGCKGEKELLEAYPDRFKFVRDEYKRRAEKAGREAK